MTIVYDANALFEELENNDYEKLILIEGDSWVSHPQMRNLSGQFDRGNSMDYLILNLANPGANAGSQYGNSDAIFRASGPQMKKLKKVLNTNDWGEAFDLIFISAAGNDVIGPEIREIPLVNNKRDFPGAYGRDLINANFWGKMDNVVKGYRRFLRMVRNTDLNSATPVITHTYAYLEPRKVGTHFFGISFNNGWIAKHLEHQGISDRDEQSEIVRAIFDRYHQHISTLQTEFSDFLVVDTRKTLLKHGLPNTDWFHDEIHPTSAGFKKVFNKIRRESKKAGLWPLEDE